MVGPKFRRTTKGGRRDVPERCTPSTATTAPQTTPMPCWERRRSLCGHAGDFGAQGEGEFGAHDANILAFTLSERTLMRFKRA